MQLYPIVTKLHLLIDLVRVVGLETYLVYIKLARARLVCRELQAGNIVHYLEYYYHKMASVVTHQVMENSRDTIENSPSEGTTTISNVIMIYI